MLAEKSVNNLVSRDRWSRLGSRPCQFQAGCYWASYLTFLIFTFLTVNKQNVSTFFLGSMQILNEKIFLTCLTLSYYYYERENKSHLKWHRQRTKIIIKCWGIQEAAIELGHRVVNFWQVLMVALGSMLKGLEAGELAVKIAVCLDYRSHLRKYWEMGLKT